MSVGLTGPRPGGDSHTGFTVREAGHRASAARSDGAPERGMYQNTPMALVGQFGTEVPATGESAARVAAPEGDVLPAPPADSVG